MRPKQVVICTTAFLSTLLGAYLIMRLLSVIILYFLAFIFASSITPLVARLNRKLPLTVSIALVYLAVLLVVTGVFSILIPPLVQQAGELLESAPNLIRKAQAGLQDLRRSLRIPGNIPAFNLESSYNRLLRNAPALATGALNIATGFITGIAGIVLVLAFSFYWILEKRDIEGTWLSLVPAGRRARVYEAIGELESKLGGYVTGQITLATIVGVASYIGLKVIGVEFALVLALLAGMTEFIPLLGPIIAATPAILIALAQSPRLAILVVVLYVVIQQVENYLLVPKVMERSVGLSPLTVLSVILAGTALLGIVGAMLAVPVAIAVKLILEHTIFTGQEARSEAAVWSDDTSAAALPRRRTYAACVRHRVPQCAIVVCIFASCRDSARYGGDDGARDSSGESGLSAAARAPYSHACSTQRQRGGRLSEAERRARGGQVL